MLKPALSCPRLRAWPDQCGIGPGIPLPDRRPDPPFPGRADFPRQSGRPCPALRARAVFPIIRSFTNDDDTAGKCRSVTCPTHRRESVATMAWHEARLDACPLQSSGCARSPATAPAAGKRPESPRRSRHHWPRGPDDVLASAELPCGASGTRCTPLRMQTSEHALQRLKIGDPLCRFVRGCPC